MKNKKGIYIYTIIMSIIFIGYLCYYSALLYRQFYGIIPILPEENGASLVYYNTTFILLMNLILFVITFLPVIIYRHKELKKKMDNKIAC